MNGITFSSGFPSSEQATVSPSTYSGAGWGENNPVFGGGWVWSKSGSQDIVFTLKGLTSGHKYCVQILAANHWSGSSTTLSAGDLTPFEATKNNDYKYGRRFPEKPGGRLYLFRQGKAASFRLRREAFSDRCGSNAG